MGLLAAVAVGWLMAGVLFGGAGAEGTGLGLLHPLLLGAAGVVLVTIVRRRRRATRDHAVRPAASVPRGVAMPPPGDTAGDRPDAGASSSLADGVRDIRRTDPKFDPARLTGYVEMVFRAAHAARMRGDVASLRDRLTSELYGELLARETRLRDLGHASHVDQIEVRAQVTEAWHETGRDYVTAYIAGAMLHYTVDEGTGNLVAGSTTILEDVETFWTFARPAGLHPWMLSAIQAS